MSSQTGTQQPEKHGKPPAEALAAIDSLERVRKDLGGFLIDRDIAIHLSILALIARENMILLGPPGTAKSLLASELCSRISGASYFQRLLTKFTKESELFISGQGIVEEYRDEPEGRIKLTRIRNFHERMLPQSHIAFLDEVFKGNSAILNSLLSLINERVYYSNEGRPLQSGLLCLFGASNERPSMEDGLEALYDRFLIRYYVDYLRGDDFTKMLLLEPPRRTGQATVSLEELETLNRSLVDVVISKEIVESIYRLRERLTAHPTLNVLRPSDRRMKNALKLLKANALLDRRLEVRPVDIEMVFPYVLWDTAPGVSHNIKVQLLDDLIKELRKDSISLARIMDIEKECIGCRKDLEAIAAKVHKAGGSTDTLGKAISESRMQVVQMRSKLETLSGELAKMADPAHGPEEAIRKRVAGLVETLSKECERQHGEFVAALMAVRGGGVKDGKTGISP